MSGSDISWAICKCAPCCRQTTTPAPHHSSFFTGQMPFLPPNQQRQSTEGNIKLVVSKKWCKIDMLLLHNTNRKYHIAYRFVPFPMTLDNFEGHSPVVGLIKCNLPNISATFCTVSTDTARRAVPQLHVDHVLVPFVLFDIVLPYLYCVWHPNPFKFRGVKKETLFHSNCNIGLWACNYFWPTVGMLVYFLCIWQECISKLSCSVRCSSLTSSRLWVDEWQFCNFVFIFVAIYSMAYWIVKD